MGKEGVKDVLGGGASILGWNLKDLWARMFPLAEEAEFFSWARNVRRNRQVLQVPSEVLGAVKALDSLGPSAEAGRAAGAAEHIRVSLLRELEFARLCPTVASWMFQGSMELLWDDKLAPERRAELVGSLFHEMLSTPSQQAFTDLLCLWRRLPLNPSTRNLAFDLSFRLGTAAVVGGQHSVASEVATFGVMEAERRFSDPDAANEADLHVWCACKRLQAVAQAHSRFYSDDAFELFRPAEEAVNALIRARHPRALGHRQRLRREVCRLLARRQVTGLGDWWPSGLDSICASKQSALSEFLLHWDAYKVEPLDFDTVAKAQLLLLGDQKASVAALTQGWGLYLDRQRKFERDRAGRPPNAYAAINLEITDVLVKLSRKEFEKASSVWSATLRVHMGGNVPANLMDYARHIGKELLLSRTGINTSP
ncbi:MAG TPA: hypothetical protein VG944_04915 [Fimbriimonas sp.]|nr:hypothetical protein [Fimbriimonas sp.]